MKRSGSARVAIRAILVTLAVCLIVTTAFAQSSPGGKADGVHLAYVATPPPIDTIYACVEGYVYDTIAIVTKSGTDPKVSLTLSEGPGELYGVHKTPDTVFGYFRHIPEELGLYEFTFSFTDAGGTTSPIYLDHFVLLNTPPTIEDLGFSVELCFVVEPREIDMVVDDPDGDMLGFALLSGPGSIHPLSGLLSYEPDTAGVFVFRVEVSDKCGADTATITDTVRLNEPPVVSCIDSLIVLCAPQEICFDVFGMDPDGDAFEIFELQGIGQFELTSDTSGRVCFLPADVDSAVYNFVFRAADSCILNLEGKTPPCCMDTCQVTVVINRPPALACPDTLRVSLCSPDLFCFDVAASDPDNTDLLYSAWGDGVSLEGTTACVAIEAAGSYVVNLAVEDACGHADTCAVVVIAELNSPPQIAVEAPSSLQLCALEEMCFPYDVVDVDGNLDSVWASIGVFVDGQVCFTPETFGVYTVTLFAIDSCEELQSTTAEIRIDQIDQLELDLGQDFTRELCDPEEICIPSGLDIQSEDMLQLNFGAFSIETGQICFVPDTSGRYELIGTLTDGCGNVSVDTVEIIVTYLETASVQLGDDQLREMCAPEEICVSLAIEGDYSELASSIGTIDLESGAVCFTPDTAGQYTVRVTLLDQCGNERSDVASVTVDLGEAPVISNFESQELYLCSPQEVCLPFSVVDPDGDLARVTVNRGSIRDGAVCFVPYDKGAYRIILTAVDSCGLTTVDTAMVTIRTDQDVRLIVPNDTSFFACELDTFCFPVSGIPDGAAVQVSGINTWFDAENSQICYFAECASANKITLSVTTGCGTYSKKFTVTVHCNTAPLALLPPDTALILCEPGEVCIPVGINDYDGNLMSTVVTGGQLNEATGRICFPVDTTGVYRLTVTATDSCGVSDMDSIFVTVIVNKSPICYLPEDTSMFLCAPSQVVLPIFVEDDGVATCRIVDGPGQIVDGFWLYNATVDDTLRVTVRCSDECGHFCEDSFMVVVDVNQAPVCETIEDEAFVLCRPELIQIPLGASDPDNNLAECVLIEGPGGIVDGMLQFVPESAGTFDFVVRCLDQCGEYCEQSFSVTVDLNDAPVCMLPGDTLIELCQAGEVSLPVSASDDGGAACSIASGPGQLVDGQWVYLAEADESFTVTITCTDSCGVACEDSFTVEIRLNTPPVCLVPEDTLISLCDPIAVMLPVGATDDDGFVTCEILDGPGQLVDGSWIYTPEGSEVVTVTVRCTDDCGVYCDAQFTVTFDINTAPTLTGHEFGENYCAPGGLRTIELSEFAYDPDGDELTWWLTGFGTIDPVSGVLSYPIDSAGTILFNVWITDGCDTVSAPFTDVIGLNRLPVVAGFDTTIHACLVPEEICFVTYGSDPDGDPITMLLVSAPEGAQFTTISDTSGRTCFVPNDVPEYTYEFVYSVTDFCGDFPEKYDAQNQVDTVRVTVIIDQAPTLDCPGELLLTGCDDFCFTVGAQDPEGGPLAFSVLSELATVDANGQVCLDQSASGVFMIPVVVTDTCGKADTCTVAVTVEGNRPPQIAAEDLSVFLCGPSEVCFEFGVSDPDLNLDSVWTNLGTLNAAEGTVCFVPDTTTSYRFILSAVDSCGAVTADTVIVSVRLNSAPIIAPMEDVAVSQCAPAEICLDVMVTDTDENLASVTSSFGEFDGETGELCFMPDTAGVYTIVITAYDQCEAIDADTVLVTVDLSEAPFVDLGEDIARILCAPEEICVDLDVSAGYTEMTLSEGARYDVETGAICVTPQASGSYQVWVRVANDCQQETADTMTIDVEINRSPIVTGLRDTTVYLCSPASICLPVAIDDPDGNLSRVQTNRGSYADGQVCFVPYDSGSYNIIVTATDECGVVAVDTAVVHVRTDQVMQLDCPNDTTIFTCELDTVSLPLSGYTDYAQISVSGVNTWFDRDAGMIRFLPECALVNRIVVTATTPCGTYSCEFRVTIKCNTEPLVIFAPDTTVVLCEPGEVCLPVGISDINRNLLQIEENGGDYNPVTGRFCFFADTAGVYTLELTAIDSCGAVGSDLAHVTVRLNGAPQAEFELADSTFVVCDGSVCVPVILSDPDDNLTAVTSAFGTITVQTGQLCFDVDTSGTYCIPLNLTDACGAETIDTVCVIVRNGSVIEFQCPERIAVDSLCEPGDVCIELPLDDQIYAVTTNIGSFADGSFCFAADTSGTYTVELTIQAECNSLVCEFAVEVGIKEPVAFVTCPGDQTVLVCGATQVCFAYEVAGAFDSVVAVGQYAVSGQPCIEFTQPGTYPTLLVAFGECNNDTCAVVVIGEANSLPTVSVRDTSIGVCELGPVCLPFTVADADGNIVDTTVSVGEIVDGMVCFTPAQFGLSLVIVGVADECGVYVYDTAHVTVAAGGIASIICPNDQFTTICGPDSLCVPVPITPAGATVTILENGQPSTGRYDVVHGQVCLYLNQAGLRQVTVIAESACGSDTCNFDLQVSLALSPEIACPADIDTLLCLAQPETVCFPVEVSGTGVAVTVKPSGSYSAGVVCFPVTTAGQYTVDIIATGVCGVDSCRTMVTVTDDQGPTITVPADFTYEWCPDDTDQVCVDGIFADDSRGIVSLTKVCGPGTFAAASVDSGQLCFVPDGPGAYEFCFEAFDGCRSVRDTIEITVIEKSNCDVCVRLTIESTDCVPVGVTTPVNLLIETNDPIGGFDLRLSYDQAVSTFVSATIDGTEVDPWEYFTYRTDSPNCSGTCPSGFVTLTAIADWNNGAAHPPVESLSPNGVMVSLSFLVANDQNLGDQFLPINFYWILCTDNSFSDPTGNYLYVNNRIYNFEDTLLWDEADDVRFPDAMRDGFSGVSDDCFDGGKEEPLRCVEFKNGGICIVHPDTLDDRGDVNLNNIAYEISDAVLFSNYFIYGLKVFTKNEAGQIAATDCNADGQTLSVADLVFLIRVVIGDAEPIPKPSVGLNTVQLQETTLDGVVTLSSSSESEIGAAHFVFDLKPGAVVNSVRPGRSAEGMQFSYEVVDNQLRVLIFDIGTNFIATGEQELLEIESIGEITLVTSDIAGYLGQPLASAVSTGLVPDGYVLGQNYPNPFNPSTSIEFALPVAGEWSLSIFNINGHMVNRYSGHDNAGSHVVVWDGTASSGERVASGVYLYRLEAAQFSATRKMILVK